jgi:hypothetical protein
MSDGVAPQDAAAQLDALLATVMPHAETAPLAARIRADLEAEAATAPRQKFARALGLALGSREFQRR